MLVTVAELPAGSGVVPTAMVAADLSTCRTRVALVAFRDAEVEHRSSRRAAVSNCCATAAGNVVVVPAATVAPAPAAPGSPLGPLGIPKSKTAAELVPLLLTVAGFPASSVVVVPTAMVAAAPGGPALPPMISTQAGVASV